MHRSCAPLDTPIGRLWVSVSPAGLVSVDRGDLPPETAELNPAACSRAVGELAAYFAGSLRELDLPLDLTATSAFDTAVYAAARTIPYGTTVSYGELALLAGHPGAARAVGGAMARCPFSPVVPCHRVIHANGGIGGWGSETWVKRWLLELEGAAVPGRPSVNGPDSRQVHRNGRARPTRHPNSRPV